MCLNQIITFVNFIRFVLQNTFYKFTNVFKKIFYICINIVDISIVSSAAWGWRFLCKKKASLDILLKFTYWNFFFGRQCWFDPVFRCFYVPPPCHFRICGDILNFCYRNLCMLFSPQFWYHNLHLFVLIWNCRFQMEVWIYPLKTSFNRKKTHPYLYGDVVNRVWKFLYDPGKLVNPWKFTYKGLLL